MALDKWQQRQVAQHARENDCSEAEALGELFPAEAPKGARRAPAVKKDEAPAA